MINGMPIELPTSMVSISIKGDIYMTFTLLVISLLDHIVTYIFVYWTSRRVVSFRVEYSYFARTKFRYR